MGWGEWPAEPERTVTQRQYGIFVGDALKGTWPSRESAERYLSRYGRRAVIKWRDVTYTRWHA